MNKLRFCIRMSCVCLVLLLSLNLAEAQEVKLHGVPFQQVLDQLFGTTSDPGLLAGKQRFELRAKDVTLTSDQAQNFFVPTSANSADLAHLISAAEQIRGTEVRIEGLLNGAPFELKLEGKEVKLEGLNMRKDQLDSLVQQLKAIPGLREAKIESLVDGNQMEVEIENRAGRVKIEDRERHIKEAHHKEAHHEAEGDHDRRTDNIERPEKTEKVERAEKIEHIERPETEHGGTGRR